MRARRASELAKDGNVVVWGFGFMQAISFSFPSVKAKVPGKNYYVVIYARKHAASLIAGYVEKRREQLPVASRLPEATF